MIDQIKPTGGLGSGSPSTFQAAAPVGPAPEKGLPVKVADAPSHGQGSPEAINASKSPEIAAKQINTHLQRSNSEVRVQSDQEAGRTVYKIVDPSSGQVLYQFPSEEMLAVAQNLRDLDKQSSAPGVLVDKKG